MKEESTRAAERDWDGESASEERKNQRGETRREETRERRNSPSSTAIKQQSIHPLDPLPFPVAANSNTSLILSEDVSAEERGESCCARGR